MATITKTDYLSIAGYIASIRTQLDTISPYLYNCANIVVLNNNFDPTIDLINPFYNTYITQSRAFDSNAGLLDVVRALNNHVLARSGFATIDLFLASTSNGSASTVDQNWADMSAEVGVTITRTH